MTIKKISKLTFLTLLAFSTYACNGSKSADNTSAGSNENPGSDNGDSTLSQSSGKTPSVIDFEIPQAIKLVKSDPKRRSKKIRDNNQSEAFKL